MRPDIADTLQRSPPASACGVTAFVTEGVAGFPPRLSDHRPQPFYVGGTDPLGWESQAHGACKPSGMVENGRADGAHVLVAFPEGRKETLLARNGRLLPERLH